MRALTTTVILCLALLLGFSIWRQAELRLEVAKERAEVARLREVIAGPLSLNNTGTSASVPWTDGPVEWTAWTAGSTLLAKGALCLDALDTPWRKATKTWGPCAADEDIARSLRFTYPDATIRECSRVTMNGRVRLSDCGQLRARGGDLVAP